MPTAAMTTISRSRGSGGCAVAAAVDISGCILPDTTEEMGMGEAADAAGRTSCCGSDRLMTPTLVVEHRHGFVRRRFVGITGMRSELATRQWRSLGAPQGCN